MSIEELLAKAEEMRRPALKRIADETNRMGIEAAMVNYLGNAATKLPPATLAQRLNRWIYRALYPDRPRFPGE